MLLSQLHSGEPAAELSLNFFNIKGYLAHVDDKVSQLLSLTAIKSYKTTFLEMDLEK